MPAGPDAYSRWADVLENGAVSMEDAGRAPAGVVPGNLAPGTSRKSTREFSGMTPADRKRTDADFGRVDADTAAFVDPYRKKMEGIEARVGSAYQQRDEAAKEMAGLTKTYYQGQAALEQRTQDFYETQANLEKQASLHAKADRESYMAQYREQLAGVRQLMQLNPDPRAKLSASGVLGLGFAQFAQGFLAARGINIDVSGQIDKWVDRELQQHQVKIQNARGAAQDTLSLYDIARQSSQDDYEARQRFRGFMIEGLKQSIQVHAARFNSSIADAHAKEQIAKLDIEQATHEEAMASSIFDKSFNVRKGFVDEAAKQGELRLQRAKASEDIRHNKAMEGAAANKNKAEHAPLPIKDLGDKEKNILGLSTGRSAVGWLVMDPKDEHARKIVDEETSRHQSLAADLAELKKLRQKAVGAMEGATGLTGATKSASSEEYREYDQQRNLIVARLQKEMTGAAATESERKMFLSTLSDDKPWESGNNAGFIDGLAGWSQRHFNVVMNNTSGVRPLKKGERYYDEDTVADPETANMSAARAGGAPADDTTQAGKAFVDATGADAADRVGGPTLATKKYHEGKGEDETQQGHGRDQAASAAEHLAMMVIRPEAYGAIADHWGTAPGTETREEVYSTAKEKLDALADGDYSISGYARYLRDRAKDDPDGLLSDMSTPVKETEQPSTTPRHRK